MKISASEVEELIEENKTLNHIFDLQHKRSLAADKLWQKATGNTHTLPDLGILLEWLMSQIRNLTSGTTELTNRIITLEEQNRAMLTALKYVEEEDGVLLEGEVVDVIISAIKKGEG